MGAIEAINHRELLGCNDGREIPSRHPWILDMDLYRINMLSARSMVRLQGVDRSLGGAHATVTHTAASASPS